VENIFWLFRDASPLYTALKSQWHTRCRNV